MIVIASDNPGVMSEISTLLKQRGDLFTVATDEIQALDAIRTDRASLLIADTGSSAFDGFALCRAVKDDTALQGFPVLCLIDLSDISALLSVLDCTADAFLTRPFDLASLSAVVSDLQARQAEGAAPAAVRTRFRITHDGKEYSVVADRRQLLEYLLTAFESATRVNKEKETMRSNLLGEIRSVGERLTTLTAERDATVHNLHEDLEERSRVISRLNAAIQAKEQAEALLKTRMENVDKELKELGAVLETTRRSDEEKSHAISLLQSDIAARETEKARIEQELTTTVRILETQARDTVSELDSARSSVAGLRVKNAEFERMLSTVQAEYEQGRITIGSLEENLKAARLSGDEWQGKCRQLESALTQTESASAARELEVKAALNNVTRDLNSIQDALEQNIRQLERELALRKQLEQQVESLTKERDALSRVGDEWEEKSRQLKSALEQAETASAAKEREVKSALNNVTSDMHAIQDALEQNIRQLKRELSARQELEKQTTILARERDERARNGEEAAARLAEARAQLETEREARIRMQTEYDAISAEHERAQDVLGTTYRELERVKEETRSLQEAQLSSTTTAGEVAELKKQLDAINADLASERSTLMGERRLRTDAERERAALSDKYADARKFLDSASRDIGVLNATLEQEQEKRAALEDSLRTNEQENRDKDRAIQALREELDAMRSAKPAEETAPAGRGGQEVPVPAPADKPADRQQAGQHKSPEPANPSPSVHIDMLSGTVTAIGKPEGDPLLPPPPSYQKTFPATKPPAALPDQTDAQAGSGSLPDLPVPGAGITTDQPAAKPSAPDQDQLRSYAEPATEIGGNIVPPSSSRIDPRDVAISRDRWLDITKWAHHTGSVTEEQRRDLIAHLMRLSKLVQKGRHLTNRQEQEIRALVARVQSLGYKFV